jgi:prolyl oligopeptidase
MSRSSHLTWAAAGLLLTSACASAPAARTDTTASSPTAAAPPAASAAPSSPPALAYPATRAADTTDTLFGTTVHDPYRWLEDASSPEVQAWMKAEDTLARGELAKLPGRDALAARLHELYYLDSTRTPTHRGDRYFYAKTHADREKAVIYWREGEKGEEKVLIDPAVRDRPSPRAGRASCSGRPRPRRARRCSPAR